MRKINWKEKPKAWELALMVAAGLLCLGQWFYLQRAHEADKEVHRRRMENIRVWTEGMVGKSPRAGLTEAELNDWRKKYPQNK